MSRNELIAKIEALNEWEQLMEEAKTQVEAIKEKTRLRAEPLPFTAENGATKLSVRLRTNDVVLITLT